MAILVPIIALGFMLLAYVGYLLVDLMWLRRLRVRTRVNRLTGTNRETRAPRPAADGEALPTITRLISGRKIADKLFMELLRAGVKLRPSEFIGISSGLSLALALVVMTLVGGVAAGLSAAIVGLLVPVAYLKTLQARRLAAFNRQLPDALAMIGSAIRTGYSFPRAMQMVAEQMPTPIADEFQRFLNETNVGLSTEAAFARMLDRVKSYDLELVVTAALVQQQVGGNLAEIVDNIAETIRERVRVQGELSALTADGRMSGVALVLLPIVLGGAILILNPGYLTPLVTEPMGRLLVSVGIGLQVIGALIIRRMLELDY